MDFDQGEKCPYYFGKVSGRVLCVNGLELDGVTPRPCSHPELNCFFTRMGIIPLPVNEPPPIEEAKKVMV